MDVAGKVAVDGCGRYGDARGPFPDQCIDIGEAAVARMLEVGDEPGRVDAGECFRSDGPDRGDPGQAGAGAPLVGEIEPEAWTRYGFDPLAVFESEERWIADEECGIGAGEHGGGVGGGGDKIGIDADKFAEEYLRVGERAARCGVGGNSADSAENALRSCGLCSVGGCECLRGVGRAVPRPEGTQRAGPDFDDKLDGANAVQGCDGASGNDGERGRERGDGDEAEVGAAGE